MAIPTEFILGSDSSSNGIAYFEMRTVSPLNQVMLPSGDSSQDFNHSPLLTISGSENSIDGYNSRQQIYVTITQAIWELLTITSQTTSCSLKLTVQWLLHSVQPFSTDVQTAVASAYMAILNSNTKENLNPQHTIHIEDNQPHHLGIIVAPSNSDNYSSGNKVGTDSSASVSSFKASNGQQIFSENTCLSSNSGHGERPPSDKQNHTYNLHCPQCNNGRCKQGCVMDLSLQTRREVLETETKLTLTLGAMLSHFDLWMNKQNNPQLAARIRRVHNSQLKKMNELPLEEQKEFLCLHFQLIVIDPVLLGKLSNLQNPSINEINDSHPLFISNLANLPYAVQEWLSLQNNERIYVEVFHISGLNEDMLEIIQENPDFYIRYFTSNI